MAKRKARIDSAAEAVRVMSKAAIEILPPNNVPLDEGDEPFFRKVVAEFARSAWSDHQLELAAMEERTRRMLANRVRQRQRRKTDPRIAMQARLSRLHRHALAQVEAIKTSKTFEHLGYSASEFVRYIERQFLPRMGAHNMSEWQVDHN